MDLEGSDISSGKDTTTLDARLDSSSSSVFPPDDSPRRKVSVFRFKKTSFWATIMAITLVVLIGIGTLLISELTGQNKGVQVNKQASSNFSVSSLPVSG